MLRLDANKKTLRKSNRRSYGLDVSPKSSSSGSRRKGGRTNVYTLIMVAHPVLIKGMMKKESMEFQCVKLHMQAF